MAENLISPASFPAIGGTMEYNHIYKPGDILHLQKDLSGNKKGANYVVLDYDQFNYVVLRLESKSIFPYSLAPAFFDITSNASKIGEVDLKQIPANLEEMIEFASEDDSKKWKNPPKLGHLENCGVLKQYIL